MFPVLGGDRVVEAGDGPSVVLATCAAFEPPVDVVDVAAAPAVVVVVVVVVVALGEAAVDVRAADLEEAGLSEAAGEEVQEPIAI